MVMTNSRRKGCYQQTYRCVKVFLLNCLTLKAVTARGEARLQVTLSSSTPALAPDTRG